MTTQRCALADMLSKWRVSVMMGSTEKAKLMNYVWSGLENYSQVNGICVEQKGRFSDKSDRTLSKLKPSYVDSSSWRDVI